VKNYLLKKIAPWHYPQRQFAKAILQEITKIPERLVVIDAPCGNGETSYNLSSYPNLEVYAYDLNEEAINNALKHFSRENLHFEQCEINEVFNKHTFTDVFCMLILFFYYLILKAH
jgi:2-polyprenyl-3-methyl-5-hydroxy-6-metoxy-1,4-benzoquinol methylase